MPARLKRDAEDSNCSRCDDTKKSRGTLGTDAWGVNELNFRKEGQT